MRNGQSVVCCCVCQELERGASQKRDVGFCRQAINIIDYVKMIQGHGQRNDSAVVGLLPWDEWHIDEDGVVCGGEAAEREANREGDESI